MPRWSKGFSAAKREISAAQAQTKVAQDQINTTMQLERLSQLARLVKRNEASLLREVLVGAIEGLKPADLTPRSRFSILPACCWPPIAMEAATTSLRTASPPGVWMPLSPRHCRGVPTSSS